MEFRKFFHTDPSTVDINAPTSITASFDDVSGVVSDCIQDGSPPRRQRILRILPRPHPLFLRPPPPSVRLLDNRPGHRQSAAVHQTWNHLLWNMGRPAHRSDCAGHRSGFAFWRFMVADRPPLGGRRKLCGRGSVAYGLHIDSPQNISVIDRLAVLIDGQNPQDPLPPGRRPPMPLLR